MFDTGVIVSLLFFVAYLIIVYKQELQFERMEFPRCDSVNAGYKLARNIFVGLHTFLAADIMILPTIIILLKSKADIL